MKELNVSHTFFRQYVITISDPSLIKGTVMVPNNYIKDNIDKYKIM
jgi:hypothetical protein